MAENRVKVEGPAVYHCMSRTVAGERMFDERAREVLRKMIWEVADFCGVEVWAYCVLENHFHVLVWVPEAPERLAREELLRRYAIFYADGSTRGYPEVEVLADILATGGEEAERWESRLLARMHDVSEFMKAVKQRFSIWFNQNHERFGTLWSERFRSVLVENAPLALKTVAAYIDLNPVRAGLVEDPGAYRWCSYAEAMAGNERVRAGLRRVVDAPENASAEQILAAYRIVLFGKGGRSRKPGKPSIPAEEVKRVLLSGGKVSSEELLRHRVAFLSAGVALGTSEFVEQVRQQLPHLRKPTSAEPSAYSRERRRVPLEADELLTLRRPYRIARRRIEKGGGDG